MYFVASVFLLFSGIAALSYQVSWVRLLGQSMGSTSASVATVLAAFFLGLALGSYLAEKITRNRINNFKPYLLLELVIGVSGLLLLPLLLNLDQLMAMWPAYGKALWFKFTIAMALMIIPTLCMGATFPVMAAILVRQQQHMGERISLLYSLNTAGAVLGALISGFMLIPWLGLDGAIYVAAAINLSIAAACWFADRRLSLPALDAPEQQQKHDGNKLALLILFVTGFTSIATEIGWTKYLSIFTGTTIYGFAAILAIFLSGITAGSWFIKRYSDQIRHFPYWMSLGLLSAGILLLLTRSGLSLVPGIYEGINHLGFDAGIKQLSKYLLIFILLFPATFIFGALFPINIQYYCGELSALRANIGKAYAINTVAAIIASLVAGFIIIPYYGTDTLLLLCALITAAAALLLLKSDTQNRKLIAGGSIVTLLLAFNLPAINYEKLIDAVDYDFDSQANSGKTPEFLFLKEGKISVISLVSYDGKYARVQANGLNESLVGIETPEEALIIESLLAYLPYYFHPDPRSVFVVGYGGGITTRAFTHTDVDSIRVVELEPAVVEASHALPDGPVKALSDSRVELEFNDARNTLLVENKRYDIIAAQPSHPWLAGASNVFTEEFFRIVDSRLNENGIFSQWINLFRMDVTTLRSIFKAFYNVFPYGVSFADLDNGDIMLIGSRKAIHIDFERINPRINEKMRKVFRQHEMYEDTDILWYFGLSRDEILAGTGDAIPNRDTNLISEVRLSALREDPQGEENPYEFLKSNYHFDLKPYVESQEELITLLKKKGRYFLGWNVPEVTNRIAEQLYQQDELAGRSLELYYYLWQHRYPLAETFYQQSSHWEDEAHLQMLHYFLTSKQLDKARAITPRLQSKNALLTAHNMLVYFNQKGTARSLADDADRDAKLWFWLAVSRSDLSRAGPKLEALAKQREQNLELVKTLIDYLHRIDREKDYNYWIRQLNKLEDMELVRLKSLQQTARENQHTQWLAEIDRRLDELGNNP